MSTTGVQRQDQYRHKATSGSQQVCDTSALMPHMAATGDHLLFPVPCVDTV